jgi:rRNA maturation endonuclease Nob1
MLPLERMLMRAVHTVLTFYLKCIGQAHRWTSENRDEQCPVCGGPARVHGLKVLEKLRESASMN